MSSVAAYVLPCRIANNSLLFLARRGLVQSPSPLVECLKIASIPYPHGADPESKEIPQIQIALSEEKQLYWCVTDVVSIVYEMGIAQVTSWAQGERSLDGLALDVFFCFLH